MHATRYETGCFRVLRFARYCGPGIGLTTLLCLTLALDVASAQTTALDLLWELGRADRGAAEFALAPRDFRQFTTDGVFLVGESDAKRDWPYVHPGPHDDWAGARPHTFRIFWGLRTGPSDGTCRLLVDVVDTTAEDPSRLRVEVNGRAFDRELSPGGGQPALHGEPAPGKPQHLSVEFPATLLRAGDNEIRLTITRGDWLIYDRLALEGPAGLVGAPVQARSFVTRVGPVRGLCEQQGRSLQPILVTVRHWGDPVECIVRVRDAAETSLRLEAGEQTAELLLPAVSQATQLPVELDISGQAVERTSALVKPVRKMVVYILPHSHTDIGYTAIQTAVEDKQVQNLRQGIQCAQRTADYPVGARFVWNVEVLWAADLYLHRLHDADRADFFAAVKSGQVALNGMYLNELTGLCRPEELLRLFRYSTELADECGSTIDTAMISDVPGYTWGTVTAMAQAGIKYFSTAPNYSDRIGDILVRWENRPFYWVAPDGQHQVLVWIPFKGYSLSHRIRELSPRFVDELHESLDRAGYSYEIAHIRWSGHSDNAVPDPAICEFVKNWNGKYAWPRFVISSASEAFRAFEQRYADQLPRVRGDWTPYWEDGAGSSAAETALNRASSDRLAQAETLFALLRPKAYPAAEFERAWKHVLLFSEHTWGAWCSVSEPQHQQTVDQWAIKQGYAIQADQQSRALLARAIAPAQELPGQGGTVSKEASGMFDVFNTLSWPRTELVLLPRDLPTAGDRVVDDQGRGTASQRLAGGDLVFVASDAPPLAAQRFRVVPGPPLVAESVKVEGAVLDNGRLRVRLDPERGGIAELTARGLDGNFVDTRNGHLLNDYLYLIGDNLADLKHSGPATIRVGETGPLVGSLIVESTAPGCRSLKREVRLVAGMDSVELINTVDKQRLAAASYLSASGKESVNFAFPFQVPQGEIRLDLPLAVVQPERDQMPSACKNWFTVGRGADVSNSERGITWVTLDAPLVQVGGITATLLNSQTNPDVWRKHVEPTQQLFAWVMNNHWGTNYRAYQEGPVVFRFVVRPHVGRDQAAAVRFAAGRSQPLVPRPAAGPHAAAEPLVQVEPSDVLLVSLKPTDDGRAVILRLFGASGEPRKATLTWTGRRPDRLSLSNTGEKPGKPVEGPVEVPGYGLVTLRADLP